MLRSLSLYLVFTWDLNTAIKRLTRKKKQRNYIYIYFFSQRVSQREDSAEKKEKK